MDIKWSYCLIGVIYILVAILKMINAMKTREFKDGKRKIIKLLVIKRDFFTTVSIICIFVTIFINGAAFKGGKPLNKASILITFLVIGFTLLNRILHIFVAEEEKELLFLGYALQKGDVESCKFKERKHFTSYDITFVKEIDSYNYTKLLVFGNEREKLKEVIQGLIKEN